MRNLLKRLLLSAAAATLSLLLAEVVVRLVAPQPRVEISPGLYAADRDLGYVLSPGYHGRLGNRVDYSTEVVVNGLGLRGRAPGGGGAPRIVVAGDSFAFGYGVEDGETFTAVLERTLGGGGVVVEGLNGGVPGYGLVEAAGWLERRGLGLDPDLMVLAIFTGNDVQNANPGNQRAVVTGDGLVGAVGEGRGLRAWLYRRSHLFVLAKDGLPPALDRRLRAALGIEASWSERNLRDEVAVYAEPPPPWLGAATAAMGDALDQLLAAARARGVTVAAVLIPDQVQLAPAAFARLLAQLDLDPAAHDRHRPTAIIERLLADRSVLTLDLTAPLARELERGGALYFRHDRHLRPAGHELVGRSVAEFVRDRLLLATGRAPAAAE